MSDAALATAWRDALRVAELLAGDAGRLGGVLLKASAGPVREAWIDHLRRHLPAGTACLRLPAHALRTGLHGGLDLAATLHSGRRVETPGLLERCRAGPLIVPMAERLDAAEAARLAAVLDNGPAGVCMIALDESDGDEAVPPVLADRLAYGVDLRAISARAAAGAAAAADAASMPKDDADLPAEDAVHALCGAALALGIESLRAAQHAWRAACAHARFESRAAPQSHDLAWAARVVLAPRATRLPPAAAEDTIDDEPHPDREAAGADAPAPDEATPDARSALDDCVVEAAAAAIPAGLLARLLAQGRDAAGRGRDAAGAGRYQRHATHGRPAGVRRARSRDLRGLDVVETLRAAVPWQTLRRQSGDGDSRIRVCADDFRITQHRRRQSTTTIFAFDASGSQALHRLAEAKGAVELLLADCYVRRDRVAVLAFRGTTAELLLPPTRSLTRAKRSLAALPGGGGTPLALALDRVAELADQVRRQDSTPLVVLLTDGRANIARDGSPGRERAQADARVSARRLGALQVEALLLDTAPQPQALAREIGTAMGARYLALPHADAHAVSAAVRDARTGPPARR